MSSFEAALAVFSGAVMPAWLCVHRTRFVGVDIDGCVDPNTARSPGDPGRRCAPEQLHELSQVAAAFQSSLKASCPPTAQKWRLLMYGEVPAHFAMTGIFTGVTDERDTKLNLSEIRTDQAAIDESPEVHPAHRKKQRKRLPAA
jgi:hypothetical protein